MPAIQLLGGLRLNCKFTASLDNRARPVRGRDTNRETDRGRERERETQTAETDDNNSG